MFRSLCPYKVHLTILQLEEYDLGRFLKWVFKHPFKRKLEQKKKLAWTMKAKLILSVAVLLNLTVILTGLVLSIKYLVLSILLTTQPYIFLSIATLLLLPLESYQKEKIKRNAAEKIAALKKLKVIGIVGSYGKTSVKEFLYQMLKTGHRVLRTPENYNTVMSISKMIDLELDENYDFFICEMGAYKIGDIKEVCEIVRPQHGILTGINEQHLERFGGIENTIRAKFELFDFIVGGDHLVAPHADRPGGLSLRKILIANGDDENIIDNYKKHGSPTILYGFSQDNFSIKNLQTNEFGSTFDLILEGKSYPCQTELIGKMNVKNVLGAATMAFKLGISPEQITGSIVELKSVPHRLEIKHVKNGIFIDDAYSANVTGFKEALELLKTYSRPKILATPGIIELGNKTHEIHYNLGILADLVCDAVILIGKSRRTKGIESGLQKIKPTYIESVRQLWPTVEKLEFVNPVVLLENDLPENY